MDYDYIKNHYSSWFEQEKELDADPNAIKQIGSVGRLKRLDNDGNATDAWADNCIFFFNNFRKNQRNETKNFSRKCNNLIKDDELWRSKSK